MDYNGLYNLSKRTVIQHEANEQESLFNWVEWAVKQYPELKLLYHIPNGGSRNPKEAANLKRQGVKPGVPDLHLPVARSGYHGLYIEMKYGDNKPTDKQKQWLKDLKEQGYKTAVCYTWGEAAELLTKYLKGAIRNENQKHN